MGFEWNEEGFEDECNLDYDRIKESKTLETVYGKTDSRGNENNYYYIFTNTKLLRYRTCWF